MQFTRDKHSHRTIASTNASRTMQPHKPKLALELAIRHADKNFNFFSPSLLEKIKTPAPQTDTTKTLELNKVNGLQTRWTKTPAGNTGLAKVAVQYSADTFVVNQSLVLRINPPAGGW
jgi:hypothetical protein